MGTTIACGGGGTCTFVITPYVATADDYAGVSIIFGAVLVAACLIWGAKQVLRTFRDRGEE